MKNGITRWLMAAVVLGALGAATPASADNITCANANFAMLGEGKTGNLSSSAAGLNVEWFKLRLVAGRSYSAMAWVPEIDASENTVNLDILWAFRDGCAVSPTGAVDSSTQEGTPVATNHSGDMDQFIPSAADCASPDGCTFYISVTAIGLNAASSVNFKFIVVETTLYAPYWQVVTAAGYDAAPQIRNSNRGDTGRVIFTAYNAAGTAVCTRDFGVFAGTPINAQGMTTFGIGGVCAGVTADFGSAQIAHLLPPGFVTANITTFSGASGLSFDAPFSQRMVWSASPGNE